MTNKLLSERLNRELDAIGVPLHSQERIDVFAKLLKIPKFKAEAILNGTTPPGPDLLEILAEELEVNPDWLVGKSEQKHHYPKEA